MVNHMGHEVKTALDGAIGGTGVAAMLTAVEHAIPTFVLWGGAALILIRLLISLRELFSGGKDRDED